MNQPKRPWVNAYDIKLVKGILFSKRALAVLALAAPLFVGLTNKFPITQTEGWQILQTVCIAALCLSLLASLIYLGIRSIGYTAGFDSFLHQARHVLWRLVLYIFLPAALITLALLAYASYRR